jgi:hypothetical protein
VIPLRNTLILIANRNLGTGVAHYPRLTANLKGDGGVFGGSQGWSLDNLDLNSH